MATAVLGDPVAAPPSDGVSRVRFSPTFANNLLASSWDGVSAERERIRAARCSPPPSPPSRLPPGSAASPAEPPRAPLRSRHRLPAPPGPHAPPPPRPPAPQTARLYDAAGAPRGVFAHPAPLLDCCFEREGAFYTGGLDCRVTRCAGAGAARGSVKAPPAARRPAAAWTRARILCRPPPPTEHNLRPLTVRTVRPRRSVDATTAQQQVLGSHGAPVKCVEWLDARGLLVTAGWDMALRLWDARLPPQSANVASAELPGKAYTLSASGQQLVVGTSGRHVWIYDVHR
jgi:hypothetical protein